MPKPNDPGQSEDAKTAPGKSEDAPGQNPADTKPVDPIEDTELDPDAPVADNELPGGERVTTLPADTAEPKG